MAKGGEEPGARAPGSGTGEAEGELQLTVLEHLEELRRRLVIAILAAVAGAVGGWFVAPAGVSFLLRPARALHVQMIYLTPSELFWVYLRVGVIVGLVAVSPVILYQLGAFVWPGLRPQERRMVLLIFPAVVVLFLAGSAFAYFVVIPYVLRFFLGLSFPGVRPTLSVQSVLGFILNLVWPFGLVFEWPAAVAGLAGIGLVTAQQLARLRRYAILLIFIVAAIITPPDPISQIVTAIPMLGLYEASVWIARLVGRRRERWLAASSEQPTS
ncbi:MAG: twin-arginine translocase subunit TatC [Clostridia bacterium]|nr:twin-arginine translocase subunit TatC [Clostridia bacterium]MCL6521793.1 twin-arginine translocase subunit TatC [Bacillota bacterium]